MNRTYENILAIISLVIVVSFAIVCSYVFHNINGRYCTGSKCNNTYDNSYKTMKHYNVEVFSNYEDYQKREKDDDALKNDVDLDEGDFRKNNVVIVSIPKQECGIFRFARFVIEDNVGVGLLERRNKSKCFESTRHFYKKIDKDIKINNSNIKLYFTELNSEYE